MVKNSASLTFVLFCFGFRVIREFRGYLTSNHLPEHNPNLQFTRPIDDDHLPQTDFPNWGSYIMARLGNEFQIGDLLIRRGDQFLIWNADGEMLQSESAKVESTLPWFYF